MAGEKMKKQFFIYLGMLALIASFGSGLVIGGELMRKKYLAQEEINQRRDNTDLSIVFEAWKRLNDKFVGKLPEDKNMVYGMVKGMTNELGDPYTAFFEPEKAKQFKEDLKGSFEGIGAEIGISNNMLTIISPIEDTPAAKAGLRPGDKILKIDNEETANLELDEAISRIRGKKDTPVKLLVMSEEDSIPREVEIIRSVIDVKSVKWEMKEEDTAYIRLAGFSEDTVAEFTNIAWDIKESKAKKIILDVRGNPGGYLDIAVDIASFFLPKNTLVVKEDFGGKKPANNYKTVYRPVLDNYPLVVIIDQGSASASEILAGALSEQKRAKLVGAKTYGKGSVQEFIPFESGATLKVTVAEWLTPKGKSINKEGINPDIEVKITAEDIKEKRDPQLEKAIEEIKNL
ncbi:MAG: S41 family peptidase [Candidatus Moranbacteria bacterium]|nr:S41 family peptidase [Candidatus Moranbacteria bacterium]